MLKLKLYLALNLSIFKLENTIYAKIVKKKNEF